MFSKLLKAFVVSLTIQICFSEVLINLHYFHVRITLHHLRISLPHEDGLGRVKNIYIKSAHYCIFGEYGVNADEIWMNGDSFYTTSYSVLVK